MTSESKPVKNKEDIVQLDAACQKIDVKWVSMSPDQHTVSLSHKISV